MIKEYPLDKRYKVSEDSTIYGIRKNKLKHNKHKSGYMTVRIGGKTLRVHRIVAITFLQKSDELKDVNHIDGNKENNHLLNLEWTNDKMNIAHAFKMGLMSNKGIKNPRNIIDENHIPIIREALRLFPVKQIASYYKVHKNTIYKIKYNQNWSYAR